MGNNSTTEIKESDIKPVKSIYLLDLELPNIEPIFDSSDEEFNNEFDNDFKEENNILDNINNKLDLLNQDIKELKKILYNNDNINKNINKNIINNDNNINKEIQINNIPNENKNYLIIDELKKSNTKQLKIMRIIIMKIIMRIIMRIIIKVL